MAAIKSELVDSATQDLHSKIYSFAGQNLSYFLTHGLPDGENMVLAIQAQFSLNFPGSHTVLAANSDGFSVSLDDPVSQEAFGRVISEWRLPPAVKRNTGEFVYDLTTAIENAGDEELLPTGESTIILIGLDIGKGQRRSLRMTIAPNPESIRVTSVAFFPFAVSYEPSEFGDVMTC